MSLKGKLILLLLAVFLPTLVIDAIVTYRSTMQQTLDDLQREAGNVRGVLMATRRVYHHQFLESGLPLNDDTLGFLPAHALGRIADDFTNWTETGLTFNNVSDRPRNAANRADQIESDAIDYFRRHPDHLERFAPFESEDGTPFYHYARPIWVESYCLKCHGARDAAPATIRDRYDTAYNYEVGDLRGIMSIKLPASDVEDRALGAFLFAFGLDVAAYSAAFIVLYWLLIRVLVHRLRRIESAARRMADGDYDCKLELPGRDEVAQVGAIFDDMVERVRVRESELQRANQVAENAARVKSDFLAHMSHEIRTPMTAILGFTDLLLEPGATADETAERIATIRRNGEHLTTVINDVLDLSKLEAGSVDLESVPCDPSVIATEVADMLRHLAVDKGLALEVESSDTIPSRILSDPARLRQILLNLVGNAIKFTESGSVRLRLNRKSDAGSRLRFDVIDTGIGMQEDELARVFQPFAQADSSMSRRFGGTGLGLAISQHLVALLGGEIQVRSRPGEGTTFSVFVAAPVADDLSPVTPVASRRSEEPARSSTTKPLADIRVLLAEDGPDNQRLIRHHLVKAGASVEVAENGRHGLVSLIEALRHGESYDVLLMDMQMPEMDGYTAASTLREMGHTMPIIALTAHAMPGDRERCLNAGCTSYATKPIDAKGLIRSILEVLELAEASA